MSTQFVENVLLQTHICGECSAIFAATDEFFRKRREDGKAFYCPNGHPRVFRETEATRLKRELEQKNAELDRTRSEYYEKRAQLDRVSRAHMKMRKRVANGVCPCCNRTFQNLSLIHI